MKGLKTALASIFPAWILYISQETFPVTLLGAVLIWFFSYAGLEDLEEILRGGGEET